jgi:aminopeptidase N
MGLLSADGRALPLTLQGQTDSANEALLVLDTAEHRWTFTGLSGLDAAPVPSLLRDFSAPVVLEDGLDDDALRVLLSHDADAFNRWEAAQRLVMSSVREALSALHSDTGSGSQMLDPALVKSFRQVLRDPSLDAAFKELVLNVPSERELFDQINGADPEQVNAVRETLLDQLARELHEDWAWAWEPTRCAMAMPRREHRAAAAPCPIWPWPCLYVRPSAHRTPCGPDAPTSDSRTRTT